MGVIPSGAVFQAERGISREALSIAYAGKAVPLDARSLGPLEKTRTFGMTPLRQAAQPRNASAPRRNVTAAIKATAQTFTESMKAPDPRRFAQTKQDRRHAEPPSPPGEFSYLRSFTSASALLSLGILLRWKLSPAWVVLGGGLAGLLLAADPKPGFLHGHVHRISSRRP